ncbi:hypothetical protein Egran_05023 [Elaphomyces granulatus]|uniref:Peroxin/Ferlin domain-containing protein n=1 Tax=Elaphomyces granulatus TaxID=519963 RepID=A0A232LT64_9EURO|nr:hypothetical protein Egran_05023 [Elaphomyces granulatus]
MENNNTSVIDLVDNTVPSVQPSDRTPTQSQPATGPTALTKLLTRGSIKSELAKRKYAKWQPDRLGVTEHPAIDQRPSLSPAPSTDGISRESAEEQQTGLETTDSALPKTQNGDQTDAPLEPELLNALDVLYENQRGWSLFGVPLYSHQSLMQFDPPAWVTRDFRESPVDVRNAQTPDPSWTWAWKCWYVDMSSDVDEDGWQYSFSFHSRFAWHGSHPWFHSFVRRRRWLRLRVKPVAGRHGRAKMGQDYFTIHTKVSSSESSIAAAAPGPSEVPVGRTSPEPPNEADEIEDIPALMRNLEASIVDRERIEALKKFVEQGGKELYYLEDQMPAIMSLFVFYTSRWQFLKYLESEIDTLSLPYDEAPDTGQSESDEMIQKRDNLARAAEAVRRYIAGHEIFDVLTEESNLDPALTASSQLAQKPLEFEEIRGIPREADVGQEGHIY